MSGALFWLRVCCLPSVIAMAPRNGEDEVSKVAVRLAKPEAMVPKPIPQPVYDLSRFTPDQLWRMAELRGRVDEVGLSGLTDGEVEELAGMSEILLAPGPAESAP